MPPRGRSQSQLLQGSCEENEESCDLGPGVRGPSHPLGWAVQPSCCPKKASLPLIVPPFLLSPLSFL